MLKILPPINLQPLPEIKCAEIFCHNYTDLTISCNFCEIKIFTLEDFIKHLQNIHFENNPLKDGKMLQECDTIELENVEDEVSLGSLKPDDDLYEEIDTIEMDHIENDINVESLGATNNLVQDFESSEEDDEQECLKILKTEEMQNSTEKKEIENTVEYYINKVNSYIFYKIKKYLVLNLYECLSIIFLVKRLGGKC